MLSIKQILLSNRNWWNFYTANKQRIRDAITNNIIKVLSCRHKIRGYRTYSCSNPDCTHVKYVPFTCKSRACSSCGKKATDAWITKQNGILPDTTWQHITYTMPSVLWDFFWYNRELFNDIAALAADTIQYVAKTQACMLGAFAAIHTFGRDLKRNVHIHLSTTLGGISNDGTTWKTLYFVQENLMKAWRYSIIMLLRDRYKKGALIIPEPLRDTLNSPASIHQFFDTQYKKQWIVYCSKSSDDYKHNVSYLGRYVKRPPIAQSKLMHYNGQEVVFKYLNHVTHSYHTFTCQTQDFIARFVQHIPDAHFRMIRYYGFLANRVRGKLLPIVYTLLNQTKTYGELAATWSMLLRKEFGVNPLTCIICQSELRLTDVDFGRPIADIIRQHRALALMNVC